MKCTSHGKTDAVGFYSYEVPRDLRRQKVEWQLPGSGGLEGMGNRCSVGTDFQFYETKSSVAGRRDRGTPM